MLASRSPSFELDISQPKLSSSYPDFLALLYHCRRLHSSTSRKAIKACSPFTLIKIPFGCSGDYLSSSGIANVTTNTNYKKKPRSQLQQALIPQKEYSHCGKEATLPPQP